MIILQRLYWHPWTYSSIAPAWVCKICWPTRGSRLCVDHGRRWHWGLPGQFRRWDWCSGWGVDAKTSEEYWDKIKEMYCIRCKSIIVMFSRTILREVRLRCGGAWSGCNGMTLNIEILLILQPSQKKIQQRLPPVTPWPWANSRKDTCPTLDAGIPEASAGVSTFSPAS